MITVIIKGKKQTMISVAIPHLQKIDDIDTDDIFYPTKDEEYGILELCSIGLGEIDDLQEAIENLDDIAMLVNDGDEYTEHGANDEVDLHWNINVDYKKNIQGEKKC